MHRQLTLIVTLAIVLVAFAQAAFATDPAIASVNVTPTMAAAGDMVNVVVTTNTTMSSLTANSQPLKQTSAGWEGYVPADQAVGLHAISISATDSNGSVHTDASAGYSTAPVVGIKNRDAASSATKARANCTLFKMWGRVTSADENSFDLNDGSGSSIHVIYPGHIVRVGDYATARGQLEKDATTTILQATDYDIVEYQGGCSITAPDLLLGYHLQKVSAPSLGKPAGQSAPVTVTFASMDPGRLLLATYADYYPPKPTVSISTTGALAGPTVIGLDNHGTVRIAASSSDGQRGIIRVHLMPTGFYLGGGPEIEVNRYDANVSIPVVCAMLDPSTRAPLPAGVGDISLGCGLPDVAVQFGNSNPAVASVLPNPLVMAGHSPGDVSYYSTHVQPTDYGTTVLSLATPSGFTTPSEQQTLTVNVVQPRMQSPGNLVVGRDLQVSSTVYFEKGPSQQADVTLTVADSSIATLTADPTREGTDTLKLVGAWHARTNYYIQGRKVGTTTFEITSPGYQPTTGTITVGPSGFLIASSNITASKYATGASISVKSARLVGDPLKFAEYQSVRGGLTVNVPVSTSDPAVGVMAAASAVFTSGNGAASVRFVPVDIGTCTITIGTPEGFIKSVDSLDRTATVTAPRIIVNSSSGVGHNLQVPLSIGLEAAPPGPVDIRVSVDDSSTALVSNASTAVGAASAVVSGVGTTATQYVYVQGLAVGQTMIHITAPGYMDAVVRLTVYPAGFMFNLWDRIGTTTLSGNTTVRVYSAYFDSQRGYVQQPLRAGVNTASVQIVCSDTSVGTVTVSPVEFTAGVGSQTTSFHPLSVGICYLSTIQPDGYDREFSDGMPSMIASVRAPDVFFGSDTSTGVDMQLRLDYELEMAPPAPVAVTATVSDSSILTVSTYPEQIGGTSATQTVNSAAWFSFRVQGRQQGSATVQLSAPGYAVKTATIQVKPSGFGFSSPGPKTISLSQTQVLTVCSGILDSLPSLVPRNLRSGLDRVYATAVCSDPSVGSITGSPVQFYQYAASGNVTFVPKSAGTCDVLLIPPAGWSLLPGFEKVTMTVQP